ncbi:MAG: DUF935 domain-containing protein [Gammaproteobacteria bacterium]
MLVDQYGRPIVASDLLGELAAPTLTGVRQVWRGNPIASGLTPQRLADVLRRAADGDADDYLTLAEEIEERDLHYASVLQTRKLGVSGLAVTVEAASDDAADQALADAVRALVEKPATADLAHDLLDAIAKGYAVVELLWETVEKRWEPGYAWRDPRFFRYDRNDGTTLRLIDEQDPTDGVPLAPYKFIVHTPRIKAGLPIRGGLARLGAFAYLCKAWSLKDWLAYADVFGMPLRLGRYEIGSSKEDIEALQRALQLLGADAAAVISRNMEVEIQAPPTGAGGDKLYAALAEFWDSQVSKAILGQTMTADNGSSLSQAQVHNDVRLDILKADARQLAGTLNRDLVRPYIDLNFGPQKAYPRIALYVPEAEDLKLLVDALAQLTPLGLEVEQSVIRDKLGLPDPESGGKLLKPAPPAGAPPLTGLPPPANPVGVNRARLCPHCGVAHQRVGADQADELDQLAETALADWEEQITPILAPVQALAKSAQSFAEFSAGLPALLEQMEPQALIEALAVAAFKARGLGDATDKIG